MKYLIISKGANSYGKRITIRAEIDRNEWSVMECPEIDFYQYTEREAIREYRKSQGLTGMHFTTIHI